MNRYHSITVRKELIERIKPVAEAEGRSVANWATQVLAAALDAGSRPMNVPIPQLVPVPQFHVPEGSMLSDKQVRICRLKYAAVSLSFIDFCEAYRIDLNSDRALPLYEKYHADHRRSICAKAPVEHPR